MALYTATIYKQSALFGEKWSNRYSINGIDIFNALEVAMNIASFEEAVSYNIIEFTKVHVVDEGDHAHTRTNTLSSTFGVLSPTGLGGPLPLFCCVRVIFENLEGKPEQKYLRLGANEANLSVGRWDGEFVDYVHEHYGSPLSEMPEYVGPHNEAHIGVSVVSAVQNRQLGWKRKHRPGFKRGWVAA